MKKLIFEKLKQMVEDGKLQFGFYKEIKEFTLESYNEKVMKTTAVEWLYEQFLDGRHHTDKEYKEIFEKAKQMEKQQIIDAYKADLYPCLDKAEQYYNETFKK